MSRKLQSDRKWQCLWAALGVVSLSVCQAALPPASAPNGAIAHAIISQVAAGVPMKIGLARAALENVGPNQIARIELPGMGTVELVGSGNQVLASGNVAWTGYLRPPGAGYAADLILAPTGIVGDIRTPAGRYRLESSTAAGQTATFFAAASGSLDQCAPLPAPSGGATITAAIVQLDAQLAAALARGDSAGIDVMFVYTSGVDARFGAALPAVLDSVVLAANSATLQSGVGVRFGLAGSMKVSPRKLIAGDLSAALLAITSSEDSSLPRNEDFVGVAARRRALGADLVVALVTHADYGVGCLAGDPCRVGAAWQTNRQSLVADPSGRHGYAIVDVSATDLSLTVVHEMGHLLGAGHDYATGGYGLFADSRGYRSRDGLHGDLMSYAPQASLVFSGPAVLCGGAACGAAGDQPLPADNVRALQASRFLVAAFVDSAPPRPPDIAGLWRDPQQSGRQLYLAPSGNGLLALWFTRDGSGGATWYVASACRLQEAKCSADLYTSWTYQGGLLSGAELDPGQVMAAKVGTIALDASNANVLSVSVEVFSQSTQAMLTNAAAPDTLAVDANLDGVWWISSGLESGVTVARRGDALSLAWFTYGSDGRGSWYLIPDCRLDAGARSCRGDLQQPGGPATNAGISPWQNVGTAGLDFTGAYAGVFSWQIGGVHAGAPVMRELATQ